MQPEQYVAAAAPGFAVAGGDKARDAVALPAGGPIGFDEICLGQRVGAAVGANIDEHVVLAEATQ